LCVIAGSFIRPVGGYLADRLGGIRMLLLVYVGIAAIMSSMTTLPALGLAAGLLFLAMSLLGIGNGAVFQLVPQRYPNEIGVLTGLVGAAGGFGGFFLPIILGALKGQTGSFSGGFLAFAVAGCASALLLAAVSQAWQREFVSRGGLAAETG
jgi:NNP family nitrate/nitrite transporter-like MFS transporter